MKSTNECHYCSSYAVGAAAGKPVCNAHVHYGNTEHCNKCGYIGNLVGHWCMPISKDNLGMGSIMKFSGEPPAYSVKPEGVKHDQGKPDLSLLDRTAIEHVAKVLGFGAVKYGRDNWRAGIDKNRLLSASLRHIYASLDGELKDPESGESHLAHGICGLMFALHFEIKGEKNEESVLSKAQREDPKSGDL